jgi:hypothetical protein
MGFDKILNANQNPTAAPRNRSSTFSRFRFKVQFIGPIITAPAKPVKH